ncbi:hypothetical protein C1930_19930 [Stenotrophomonas sp. SAU14A_NAIMI4_8]|nr:hypothetical protein C1930_19930 [Stenotrophomonas sp. SAU14A_NAIMI4_8]
MGGQRGPGGAGPSAAWMPRPSLQGRTCGVSCTVRPPLPHPTQGRRNAFLNTPTHSAKPIDRNEISSILSISYGPTPRRAHPAADAAQLRPAVRRAAVAAPG